MKIYLFHQETGFYLGEDFAEERVADGGEGLLPPDATAVVPPPYGSGEVPVFDVAAQCWKILHPQPGPRLTSDHRREIESAFSRITVQGAGLSEERMDLIDR